MSLDDETNGGRRPTPIFEPGDAVVLKGGGPPMTVTAVERHEVHCRWFDATLELMGNGFDALTLRKITPPVPVIVVITVGPITEQP